MKEPRAGRRIEGQKLVAGKGVHPTGAAEKRGEDRVIANAAGVEALLRLAGINVRYENPAC
jgi:hypothetical protein